MSKDDISGQPGSFRQESITANCRAASRASGPPAALAAAIAALLCFTSGAMAQSKGDFQTHQSGNWNSTSTWEDRQGSKWSSPAGSTPTSADGVITILAGHTVTVTSAVTVDGVVIQAGGQLTVNSGVTLTIANGTGTDLDVFGTLQNSGTIAIASGAAIVMETGAAYRHSQNGGTIPAATWSSGTTCTISGVTSSTPAGLNQAFYHFTWNCPSQSADITLGGNPTSVSGNFTVASTAARQLIGVSGTSGWTLGVGGDFILSGGSFNFSSGTAGALALNLSGSYNQTGGVFNCSNSGSTLALSFTGAGTRLVQPAGTLTTTRINFNISGGASLQLSNSLTVATGRVCTVNGALNCGTNVIAGAGSFTLANGGTLAIGSAGGISASASSGNIQVTGGRAFATGANYLYNGAGAQVSGDGLPASVNSLTLSNSAGLTLTSTLTVNGALGLTSGRLMTGSNQVNVAAAATISGAGAGSYVSGTLQKAFAAGTNQSFTFPVGGATAYAPVGLTSLNLSSGTGTLTASTTDGDHANLSLGGMDSSQSVNRYWTLTPGGSFAPSSLAATFNYLAGDVDAGASPATFVVRRYAGDWATTTIGTRTATSLQVTGLNAFGDFAIGENLADHYTVSATTPQTAGAAFNTTVSAQDLFNQTVTGDSTTAVTISGTGSVQFDSNGDGTFGDATKTLTNGACVISTRDTVAETVTLTASDASGRTGALGNLAINPAGASRLLLAAQPSATATAGQPFAQQPVVLIADAFNNVRSNDTLVVTAARSSGEGTLLGTTNLSAIGGVVTYTNLAHPVATNISIRFTSGALTAATSGVVAVSPGAFSRLLTLLPGETSAPGTPTGRAGTASAAAGANTAVRVSAADTYFNLLTTPTDTIGVTTTDPNAVAPADAPLVNGAATFNVMFLTSGSRTVTATDLTDGSTLPGTGTVTVAPGALAKLQLLAPGETAAPGTASGKTGAPSAQSAGAAYSVTANAVDANWNVVSTNDTVAITCGDTNAILPASTALASGTRTFSLTNRTAGNWTVTASDTSHPSVAAATSPSILVSAGAFSRVQVLLPGETEAAGTTAGKSGAPSPQTAGAGFSVKVNAVDANWNPVNTNDTVHLTSSDTNAVLPADAALVTGSRTLNLTCLTAGSATVTVSDVTDGSKAPGTSSSVGISAGAATSLQVLMPGELAAPGSPSGKTGAPVAQPVGTPFTVRLNAVDAYWNLATNTHTLALTAGDPAAVLPASVALVGGTATASVTFRTAGNWTVTATDTSGSPLSPNTGTVTAATAGAFTKLQLLMPGETAAPGTTTGKTGTPSALTAGVAFAVTVNAVDANWNTVNTNHSVGITSSDPNAALPASASLAAGTGSFNVTLKTAGAQTLTASDLSDGTKAPATSPSTVVNPGAFAKLQLLVPGEVAAPGTAAGKLGAPLPQGSNVAFTVIISGVDANWNPVNTNDTVHLTATDPSAILPANAALTSGTRSLSVTLRTIGSATLTASDVTHSGITANTSPAIAVVIIGVSRWGVPAVAIHDSEFTRALESIPGTAPNVPGMGASGFQWWPTNWHYFVMPETIKESLRSDGTAFKVVGDADISSGSLLDTNGRPKYPILISLAAEAVGDIELAQLTNYVAAGGFLLVGSSSFTRTTDGTTRGDFGCANEMGVHMVVPSLGNWATTANLTKVADHRLLSHVPSGTLTWRMASSAEEIPWGISPAHPFLAPHWAWQVQATTATVLAQGDTYPYLLTKAFGKGQFIYLAPMQPLMGFNSFAPTMYSYVIFRKAIEWAFESANLPVPKLSPWPYAYDAAFILRRDLENFTNAIAAVAASAQIDRTNGAFGDYYFCTGTLREDAARAYNTNTIIAGLRQAVTNYGASIYPHNGGLRNPNNPSLTRGQYDYWHWGPDEALDVTPAGYASGKAYALASISTSFRDVEFWLSGLTNGLRGWSGCYFNATREDSYDIQAQLGVNMTGDQKLSPFPHWTLSTRTSGKRYAFLTEPPSDWFVGGLVAQSLEPWHPPGVQTSQTLHAAVDFYYSLGALVNFYCHTLSTGLGDAGSLPVDYMTYSLNTNLHPRMWSANAVKVYQWWLQRSNAQISASCTAEGNQSVTTISVSGASHPDTAVEILIPATVSPLGVQVLTNGVPASGDSYRTKGSLVKIRVGTAVNVVQLRYALQPVAQNDSYSTAPDTALNVAAPGVLANDTVGSGTGLSAVLVSGPAQGALNLSPDGHFSYTPAPQFAGMDSFTYQASDGVTNSSSATVTISVLPSGIMFTDDFTRPTDPGALSPWTAQSGNWTITGGALQGGPSATFGYGIAYITNSGANYSVQAQIRFPAGAYGGGVDGRVNPVTGARYAAWVYPEGSAGGSSVLKLIKFQTWTSYAYNGSAFSPMQQVSLSGVGTNWHTLKLSVVGNQLAVYYDGARVINTTDAEAQPYLSGAVGVDMWTDAAPYAMTVGDLSVLAAQSPQIVSLQLSATTATITWGAIAGQTYRVQYKNSVSAGTWQTVAPDVTALDVTASASVPASGVSQRFYRIMLLP